MFALLLYGYNLLDGKNIVFFYIYTTIENKEEISYEITQRI